MASVMLATYPEIFAGGAIIAGLPYGSASSVQEAFEAMFNERAPSSRALGDHVRTASNHRVRGRKYRYGMGRPTPSSGRPMLITSSVNGSMCRSCRNAPQAKSRLGGIPAASGRTQTATLGLKPTASRAWRTACRLARRASDACGIAGPFFLEAGLSSTSQIAQFWGLDEAEGRQSRRHSQQLVACMLRPASLHCRSAITRRQLTYRFTTMTDLATGLRPLTPTR